MVGVIEELVTSSVELSQKVSKSFDAVQVSVPRQFMFDILFGVLCEMIYNKDGI
jgi:hypothetical protein